MFLYLQKTNGNFGPGRRIRIKLFLRRTLVRSDILWSFYRSKDWTRIFQLGVLAVKSSLLLLQYNYSWATVHTGKWRINGLTALSRLTVVAIFALPNIVSSEEVCDATKAQ